jgi:hypothetical protein
MAVGDANAVGVILHQRRVRKKLVLAKAEGESRNYRQCYTIYPPVHV